MAAHRDIARLFAVEYAIEDLAGGNTLCARRRQIAADDAVAKVEVPARVDRHRTARGDPVGDVVVRDEAAAACTGVRHEHDESAVRQRRHAIGQLLRIEAVPKLDRDAALQRRGERLEFAAQRLAGRRRIQNGDDAPRARVQAQHQLDGGRMVGALDDAGEVGKRAELRVLEPVYAAEDDRHAGKQRVAMAAQEVVGVVVGRHDGGQPGRAVFVGEEAVEVLEVRRVGQTLGVHVFNMELHRVRFGDRGADAGDLAVRPVHALMVGVEHQHVLLGQGERRPQGERDEQQRGSGKIDSARRREAHLQSL